MEGVKHGCCFVHVLDDPFAFLVEATNSPNVFIVYSLFHILIVSVLLVHAIFAMPLHAHTTPISSTSQVLFLIIIATLQLLWQFNPRVYHHLVLCRDSFFSLAVETLHILCYSRAHPFCFSYRLQRSSICQSPLRIVFIHWKKLGDSSSPLAITHKSLRIFWQKPSMVSRSYTVKSNISPSIILKFTCTVGLAPWDLAFI